MRVPVSYRECFELECVSILSKAYLGADKQFESLDVGRLIILGILGHPNPGKSSLINGIMGKKAVSKSKKL